MCEVKPEHPMRASRGNSRHMENDGRLSHLLIINHEERGNKVEVARRVVGSNLLAVIGKVLLEPRLSDLLVQQAIV